MGLWRSAAGTVDLRITSADIPGALSLLSECGIILYDICYNDDLSAIITVLHKDQAQVCSLLQKRGDSCESVKKWGIHWLLFQFPKRMILLFGVAALVFLTLFIPSRVLFVRVVGNKNVPTNYILEKLQDHGLTFGCVRADIRSDQFKNSLLENTPELSWVGITTAGCVATVEVKENEAITQKADQYQVSSIVATTDGVVEEITATKGTPLCIPGQAVRSGQTLISAYEDRGSVLKALAAEGEVYAKTLRVLQTRTPNLIIHRTGHTHKKVYYRLQIGKKQINLLKDSGISPASCVKMYSRYDLMLPGGFQLPISLIREEWIFYDTAEADLTETDPAWLEDYADSYIKELMLGGQILQKHSLLTLQDGAIIIKSQYYCREQIGIRKNEEIMN